MTTRKPKNTRTKEIMTAALDLAEKQGYQSLTRDLIAAAAQCSPAHVSGLFGTMVQIRRRLMRAAVQQKRLRVIAQGVAARDPACDKLPDAIRQQAADSLKG